MKKETILTIVVCVLVVVAGIVGGYVLGDKLKEATECECPPPTSFAIWSCRNRTDNWSSVVPLYEDGQSGWVYPDAYEITVYTTHIATGEKTEKSYLYCELTRLP